MSNKKIFFYGILKSGEVIECNSDNAFSNNNIMYLIKGDFIRSTPKEFSIFEYSLFNNNSKLENRTIKWGNIKCTLPKSDIWGSVTGKNHQGVIFKIILNDTFEITFPFQDHSIETIKEIMNLLIYLTNHNTIVVEK